MLPAATCRDLDGLKRGLELQDPATGRHSRRVSRLVVKTLNELGWCGREAEPIIWAASVHDIGKLGVSRKVLTKAGSLRVEERRLVERHVTVGAEWLAGYSELGRVAELVRHHHERWDGRGYPDCLAGTRIPFGAQVIAVADSYDVMTSDRPYRPAMTAGRAAELLRAGRWQQWNGSIVDAFLYAIQQHPEEKIAAA